MGLSAAGAADAKTFFGLSTSLGHSKNMREVNGNDKNDRHNPPKTRPIKAGCKKPTVKVGMGARQRASGGLKKNKKKKARIMKHNKATSSKENEQNEDGVIGVQVKLADHVERPLLSVNFSVLFVSITGLPGKRAKKVSHTAEIQDQIDPVHNAV
ncbi:hypothetical protein Ancab_032469 [Ancistrocladus abbreviatus]